MRISTVLILFAVAAAAAGTASVMRARRDLAGARFVPGDRVRVSATYHWARGATGTVRLPPPPVAGQAGDWRGQVRRVQGAKGVLTFYWVQFDEAQRDADGDGPYRGGEIDGAYLEPR